MLNKLIETISDKLVKESLWAFLTKGITFILFIFINVIIANSLGPSSFGAWSLIFSILTITYTISFLGINQSSQKFVAEYNYTDKITLIIKKTLFLRVYFSIIFLFLSITIYFLFSKYIIFEEVLIIISILFIFFMSLNEYFKSIFQGLHTIKYNFLINTIEYVIKLLLIIYFLYYSMLTINNIILSFLISVVISSLIGITFLFIYLKIKSKIRSSNNVTKEIKYKNIIHYSIPLFIISLGFLLLTEIDILMLGLLSNTYEIGIYNSAKNILIKFPQISFALAIGTLPIFAKINKKNKYYYKNKFYQILKIVSIIFLFILILIQIFAPFIISIFYGNNYNDAINILRLFSIYIFIFSISIIISGVMDYIGKAKKRAYNMLLTIFLNIILNFFFIPQFGSYGAIISSIISFLPYIILNFIEVKKELS